MTTVLERTLSQVSAKIHRARVSHLPSELEIMENIDSLTSELIAPILAALGWNFEDSEEVRVNFTLDGCTVDSALALYLHDIPRLLVGIRAMGEEYDGECVMSGLLPRAREAGFEWLLLTDGNDYDIFNTRADPPAEHRPFDTIRISNDSKTEALDFFKVFSRKRMRENRIESEWRHRIIDKKVREAVEELFAPNEALLELISRKAQNLTAQDIRGSLERARLVLGFEYHDELETDAERAVDGQRANYMSEAELRIATWLQRRSIERWAKGRAAVCRNRASRRRVLENRRSNVDRRSGLKDRRIAKVARADERRVVPDRRVGDRRSDGDRRLLADRRKVRRPA